ncbi:Ig-like domain-containing protein [Pseudomonas sp. S2_B03]
MTSSQYLIFPPAPRSGIGVLALYPPQPLLHKLQTDQSYGINIAMIAQNINGLGFSLPAYLSQALGDRIEVFLDRPDVTTPSSVIDFALTEDDFEADGKTPKTVLFDITAETLEEKFLPFTDVRLDCWIKVTRLSGNPGESPHSQLWFKHPAPGEADIDGGKPSNQGLKLPIASESIVDQNVIKEGMEVTVKHYFNQQIGDTVVLTFGSLRLDFVVTDDSADIVFKLTPDLLGKLQQTSNLVVRWSVYDIVENSSGFSEPLILPFKPVITLLTAPIFEQSDADDVIHHDWLAGGPTNILLTGSFAINDVIALTLEGFTRTNVPVTHTYSLTVTVDSKTLNFPVENFRIQNVIGGSLRATYILTRAGQSKLSKPADVTVAGKSLPLGAPEVTPLVEGELAVDTAKAFINVASFWPLKQGAEVKLHWQTTDINGKLVRFTWGQLVTDPSKPIVFEAENEYIKPYASARLAVQATITNPGESEVFSDIAQLKIGDPKELVLTPPSLVSPFTNPLDPLAALPSMLVEYLDAKTEKVRLVCTPLPLGFDRFPLVDLDSAKQARFPFDRRLIVALHGETVRFKFNLNQDGKKIGSSPETEISFKLIADQDPRFPRPRIIGIDNAILDVKKLTSADKLAVNLWHGQRPGQSMTLVLIGIDSKDIPVRHVIMNAEASVTSAGLIRELSTPTLEVLKNLKSGSTATLIFSVRLGLRGNPVEFPHQTYQIESLVELQPVITLIKDSQNREIPHSDLTVDPNVTVEGTASVEQQVEVLVNGKSIETLTTDKDGKFSTLLKGLVVDVLTVVQIRALYGDGLLSPLRSFTLRKALQVNNSAMALSGLRVYAWRHTHSADFPNNTQIRAAVPSTGVHPITYRSSNPNVAYVDGNGKVTGIRNGNTYITVQDRFSSFSYYVSVTNVYQLAIGGYGMTHQEALNWRYSIPGAEPMSRALHAMQVVYGPDPYWPIAAGGIYRMCDESGCPGNLRAIYGHANGGIYCHSDLNARWAPWCIYPIYG